MNNMSVYDVVMLHAEDSLIILMPSIFSLQQLLSHNEILHVDDPTTLKE